MSKIKSSFVQSIINNSELHIWEKEKIINELPDQFVMTKVAEKIISDWRYSVEKKRNIIKARLINPNYWRSQRDIKSRLRTFSRIQFGSSELKSVFESLIDRDLKLAKKVAIDYRKLLSEKEYLYNNFRLIYSNNGNSYRSDSLKVNFSEYLNKGLTLLSYTELNDYFIHCKEERSEDWDYYSKSWHRKHGPKVTTDGRYVIFTHKVTLKQTKICVDSWRGQYLLNAIVEFFNIPVIPVAKEYRKVQLDEHFTINLVKEFNGVQIWRRSILDQTWDYCIVHNKETFHAPTIKKCFEGLRKKRQARLEKDLETIDYPKARMYGFCRSGIISFCEDNDLNIDGSYTIKELRAIVLQNKELNCQKYAKDLSKIGIKLNCK